MSAIHRESYRSGETPYALNERSLSLLLHKLFHQFPILLHITNHFIIQLDLSITAKISSLDSVINENDVLHRVDTGKIQLGAPSSQRSFSMIPLWLYYKFCLTFDGQQQKMANIRASKKMNEKKKVPQRGLGIAQLERIRLEEQHKKDSIFQTIQCPEFIPTSSRIDFSSKDCVFTPNQTAPFLENSSKLCSGEYSQGVNQKVDHHAVVVFGHNLNSPSVLQQRCQKYQKISSTSIMAGVKRHYPFEIVSKSRALSESKPSNSVRETKALNGDFLSLTPQAAASPHLEAVTQCSLTNSAPKCLQLFDYVPSRVAAAEDTPPSGLSIPVQQPILGLSPSAKVQIDREGTRGSDFHTEVEGKEQHKKDSIFHTIQCPKFMPTSSRIDFSLKDCVFTPNQSSPFLENCSKLWSGEYSQGVNQKIDHHGVVFGHNLNFPNGWREEALSVLFRIPACPFISMQNVLCCPYIQITRNCLQQQRVLIPQRGLGIAQLERIRLEEQHHQELISTSSRIDFSSKDCVFTPNQTAPYLENCSKLWSGEYSQGVNQNVDHHAVVVFGKNLKSPSVLQQRCQQYQKTSSTSIMAGVKRPYPFEIVSKSKALSESKPSISVRETKALNGDFLSLTPPAAASPHLEAVTQCSLTNSAPKCLQLFNYGPSWVRLNDYNVAAAEDTPPSGLSIPVQPILGFFPSAKVQIDREGTCGSDFHTETLVFTPKQPTPFLENCSKLWSGEYSQGVNQKVDHHGVVFGHNLNFPSMAGVKRTYPFSSEYPPVPSFRCKMCCVSPVSRSHETASSSNEEVVLKLRALSESEPSISLRETKALNGDFLRLAPPAAALPHLEAVNRCSLTDSAPQCLQLFDYVPSRVAAAEHMPPSGLSISVQQTILGFFPSAKVQIGRERTHGSELHTEIGGNVDLELKL
ncbi:hypothetical protein H5410_049644 [Solanum commersonii]|uniref:Uncharacterized protein n=1 Tax=Solanum commersonii TaxID=4109 RepID=A0A9J5WT62_SOLCO|nr:hypothetical protein H5410_049644 [Solanum commersonii]